jgi:hypothetical protein
VASCAESSAVVILPDRILVSVLVVTKNGHLNNYEALVVVVVIFFLAMFVAASFQCSLDSHGSSLLVILLFAILSPVSVE